MRLEEIQNKKIYVKISQPVRINATQQNSNLTGLDSWGFKKQTTIWMKMYVDTVLLLY